MATGTPLSFDEAFDSLYGRAFGLAQRILGDPGDAQDAAAEALARALAQWKRVSRLPYVDGWVLRVTGNVAVDVLRRRRTLPDEAMVGGALAEVVFEAADIDVRMALVDALRRLPRRQVEVLVLRYLADLSESDVASSLGISAGSVKQHASRGLERLRGLLGAAEFREVHVAY